jgi:GT2 family glycosyltransferase
MTNPQVTIVVSPRERFSCTRESLESIYELTDTPFKLVYVDGNSPREVRCYLEAQSQEKNFQLVRTENYLSPNQARNIGLAQVDTKYVVFFDNDVIVSPGWLDALVQCAEETDASVVGPLMCQHLPLHEVVHFAGGESRIVEDVKGGRHLREKMYKQGHRVAKVRDQLQRTPTELAEFHCVLVRTAIFEKIGPLDEAMFNTKEHLDFCMTVAEAGGTVYFEPDSIVTYVPGPPLELTDIPFYMLRWSDAWVLNSLQRLREKWDLTEDGYFKYKYKVLGWRRRETILRPLSRKLTFGIKSQWMEKALVPFDKVLNRYLTDRYMKKYLAQKQQQAANSLPPAITAKPLQPTKTMTAVK